MRSSMLLASLLSTLVAADWRMWNGPCDDGSDYPDAGGNFGMMTTGSSASNGCGATGTGGGYADFESGNPCNCDDILQYKWTGSDYRIIVKNTQIDIGECHETDNIKDTMEGALYACIMDSNWECSSAYCVPS